MRTEEELEEEQFTPEQEAVEDAPGEAPADFDIDEDEYRLTTRQKVWIVVGLIASFAVFTLLMFPREIFLRMVLSRVSTQVRIDFSSADPGLLGQSFQSLRFATPDGTSFFTEDLDSNLHVFDLIRGSGSGEVNLKGADFSSTNVALRAQGGIIGLNLTGMSDGLTAMRGELSISMKDVGITRLPTDIGAILPLDVSKIRIDTMQLPIAFREGGLSIQNGLIASNLFNVRIQMAGKYQGVNLDSMGLDGRICLKPAANLEQNQPDVFGMYVFAGGSAGGDLCFLVKGTLSHPQFSKP